MADDLHPVLDILEDAEITLPCSWIAFLQEQRLVNGSYSRRDQQELRTLLLACERPPTVRLDRQFLRDRLKLYVVVAHRGWAAALQSLPDWELAQLGISLPTASAPPTHTPAPPAPAPAYLPQVPAHYYGGPPLQAGYAAAAPAGPRRRKRRKVPAAQAAA